MTRPSDSFAADYQRMVGEIRMFSLKHELPIPVIVCHRKWRDEIARMTETAVAYDRMQYMGVTFRFGNIEQGDILR